MAKPELRWEHPGPERLHARLEAEYERHERGRALDRKLQLIGNTAETLADLLQSQRSVRVEWYVVALIVAELVLRPLFLFRQQDSPAVTNKGH